MTIIQDLDQLQELPKRIEQARLRVQHLRAKAGLHSVTWDAMPKGSSSRDKTGDLVADIVDTEEEIQQLEKELWEVRIRVSDWISLQDDIKAALILGLRYLDGMSWDRVAEECRGTGEDITGSAARLYVKRYLKKYGC